ncbi:hypothetical protein LOAG_03993 [Loa loa]|uniref:Uncharacterized protein n=1 Tax=Loa loa TaxID=7209 RepID=A0A1S0U3L7_LOALO|nr:hypothetical protein LOAG_03993 [Loa loa]EFO24492.1 hypothetical protein LOAG_03993 [Loa loa]
MSVIEINAVRVFSFAFFARYAFPLSSTVFLIAKRKFCVYRLDPPYATNKYQTNIYSLFGIGVTDWDEIAWYDFVGMEKDDHRPPMVMTMNITTITYHQSCQSASNNING